MLKVERGLAYPTVNWKDRAKEIGMGLTMDALTAVLTGQYWEQQKENLMAPQLDQQWVQCWVPRLD